MIDRTELGISSRWLLPCLFVSMVVGGNAAQPTPEPTSPYRDRSPLSSSPKPADPAAWTYSMVGKSSIDALEIPGQAFVVSPDDGSVILWREGHIEVRDPDLVQVRTKIRHGSRVARLVLHKNRIYARGFDDGKLSAFDLKKKKRLWSATVPLEKEKHHHFDVSPKGKWIAAVTGKEVVLLSGKGKIVARCSSHQNFTFFTPDEKYLFAGGKFQSVRANLHPDRAKNLEIPKNHTNMIGTSIFRSPGARHLLLFSPTGIHEVQPGKKRWKTRYSGEIPFLDPTLATPTPDGVLWAGPENYAKPHVLLLGNESTVATHTVAENLTRAHLRLSPDGSRLYAGSQRVSSILKVLSLAGDDREKLTFDEFAADVTQVRRADQPARTLHWGEDGSVATLSRRLDPETGQVEPIEVPEGKLLASIATHALYERGEGEEKRLFLIDRASGEETVVPPIDESPSKYKKYRLTQGGQVLQVIVPTVQINGGEPQPGWFQLFDLSTGESIGDRRTGAAFVAPDLRTFSVPEDRSGLICLSPDGKKLWKVSAKKVAGSPHFINPSGTRILTSGAILDTKNGREIARWHDPGERIFQSFALPGGTQALVSEVPFHRGDSRKRAGAMIEELSIYDLESGKLTAHLELQGPVHSIVSVGPDARFILAMVHAGAKKHLRLFRRDGEPDSGL